MYYDQILYLKGIDVFKWVGREKERQREVWTVITLRDKNLTRL